MDFFGYHISITKAEDRYSTSSTRHGKGGRIVEGSRIGRYTASAIVMGDTGVGKTTLINTITKKSYEGVAEPSLIEAVQTDPPRKFPLTLYDGVNNEVYEQYLQEYMISRCDCILLCYNVHKRESFDHCSSYVEKIVKCKGTFYPSLLLIGLQADTMDDACVTAEEGREQCRAWRTGDFFLDTDLSNMMDRLMNVAFGCHCTTLLRWTGNVEEKKDEPSRCILG